MHPEKLLLQRCTKAKTRKWLIDAFEGRLIAVLAAHDFARCDYEVKSGRIRGIWV